MLRAARIRTPDGYRGGQDLRQPERFETPSSAATAHRARPGLLKTVDAFWQGENTAIAETILINRDIHQ